MKKKGIKIIIKKNEITIKGNLDAFRKAKTECIKKYGVE